MRARVWVRERADSSTRLQPATAACFYLLAHRARSHLLGSLQLHVHARTLHPAEELV